MFSLLALSMTLATSEPSLAGGPLQAPPPPAGTVVIETPCPAGARLVADCRRDSRVEQRSTYTAHQRSSVYRETSRSESHRSEFSAYSASGRRTVTLSDGFFAGGLTGGVEARQAPYWGYGQRVIVIGGSHAPQSAGQAAAARGLGRASH